MKLILSLNSLNLRGVGHMKQITERQSWRLKNEIEKLEQRIADQQDRLNNIQILYILNKYS